MKDEKERGPEKYSRRDSWYMRGWRKEDVLLPGGKTRTDWVYRGEYYDFPPEAPRPLIRVMAAVCAVVLTAVYLPAGIWPSDGGITPWVAYPYFLGLVPLLYFLMGSFWMAYTPGPMTYRRYHASFLRLRGAGRAGALWMIVPLAGEVVFLFSGEVVSWGRELAQFICMLVCEGQYLMVLRILKRYPMENTGPVK